MPRLNETFPRICHEWHKKVSIQDFQFYKCCHSQFFSHFYALLIVFRLFFWLILGRFMRCFGAAFWDAKSGWCFYLGFSMCGGRVASFSGFSGCFRSFYFYEEDRDERRLNGRLHPLCSLATCFVSPICRHQVKKDHPKDQWFQYMTKIPPHVLLPLNNCWSPKLKVQVCF